MYFIKLSILWISDLYFKVKKKDDLNEIIYLVCVAFIQKLSSCFRKTNHKCFGVSIENDESLFGIGFHVLQNGCRKEVHIGAKDCTCYWCMLIFGFQNGKNTSYLLLIGHILIWHNKIFGYSFSMFLLNN